jgi:hypothetical protein
VQRVDRTEVLGNRSVVFHMRGRDTFLNRQTFVRRRNALRTTTGLSVVGNRRLPTPTLLDSRRNGSARGMRLRRMRRWP